MVWSPLGLLAVLIPGCSPSNKTSDPYSLSSSLNKLWDRAKIQRILSSFFIQAEKTFCNGLTVQRNLNRVTAGLKKKKKFYIYNIQTMNTLLHIRHFFHQIPKSSYLWMDNLSCKSNAIECKYLHLNWFLGKKKKEKGNWATFSQCIRKVE